MAKGVSLKVDTVIVGGKSRSKRASSDEIKGAMTATVDRGVRKLRDPVEDTLRAVYKALAKRHGQPWSPRGLFGSRRRVALQTRSGGGLKSILDTIDVKWNRQGGQVGTLSAGALAVHEKGGSVRPKNSKYMAIPTVYAMNSNGTDRYYSPWNIPGKTFVKKSARGNRFIMQRNSGGKLTPYYLLKKRIVIPPRLGFAAEFEKQTIRFEDRMRKALAAELGAL